MIPDRIIAFLDGPVILHAASRDGQLQPYISRALGKVAVPDREMIRVYIPRQYAPKMLDNCAHHKRVALVVCNVTNFETYQFKGEFISVQECGEGEYASVDAYTQQIKAACVQIGYPEELVNRWAIWNYKSCVAVCFKVDNIFCQTPGPGTGNSISE